MWLSPWGGYGGSKRQRLKYGKQQGFETNENGFSLAGPKYYVRFRDVCSDMITRYGDGLARPDDERHARPPPRVDGEPGRDEGLRVGVGGDALLVV